MLALLQVITYLDRVCLGVAGPRMQAALHIGPVAWGWIAGVFTISYALFEIPSGSLGDRLGPRRVLTRIVLWWSVFTSLTGVVSSLPLLLLVRLCFGMGEAGAFPNTSIAISKWFPSEWRATAWGICMMASQTGGALAPLLVIPIQMRFGWRMPFYLFGLVGIAWAIAWFLWFRDSPAEMPGISAEEVIETVSHSSTHSALPWRAGIRSLDLLGIMLIGACSGYTLYFFQAWFPTYMVKGRGFTESGLLLSSLTFAVGATGNLLGGFLSDALVQRFGLIWGRRLVGCLGLGSSALFLTATMLTHDKMLSLIFLSLGYGGVTLQQPDVLGVCLDIGGRYAGAATGAMNTAAFSAAFFSSVIYGYIAKGHGYDAPFIPMIVLLVLGTLVWLGIDASRQLIPNVEQTTVQPETVTT